MQHLKSQLSEDGTVPKVREEDTEKLPLPSHGELAGGHQLIPPESKDTSPIVFRYLTFETPLPPLSPIPGNTAFSPPDLSKYTSPYAWPTSHKGMVTFLSCLGTAMTAYSAGSYAPAIPQMSRLWHVGDVALSVGLTTWCIGFAVAPMVLAPFSELNGRRPVVVLSGILFAVCQLCCGVTRSYAGMLVARLFVGIGAATFGAVIGGVLADVYVKEERNTPMALFSGSVLAGTGLGPTVSGVIAEYISFRWIFYVQAIMNAVMVIGVYFGFRETRGSVLLSRKASALNAWYETCEKAGYLSFETPAESNDKTPIYARIRWKVKADEERESLSKILKTSLTRPFYLLATEPVVFFFSLWAAFAWGVLYMSFSSIPLVFGTRHDFNLAQSGAVFAAMCAGSMLATALSLLVERVRSRKEVRAGGRMPWNPERRLYLTCFASILMPIGMFWYGWTSFPSIPYIVPTLAVATFTMGIYSVYLSVFNYLADIYGPYASSALAAQSFCRNIAGGVLPLVNNAMFRNLTYQGASSLLGGLGLLLTMVPWVLVMFGPRIRARSRFASGV